MATGGDWRDRARAIMERDGVTVLEISRAMDCTTQAIYQLLKRENPNLKSIQDLSAVLGCTVGDLLDGR